MRSLNAQKSASKKIRGPTKLLLGLGVLAVLITGATIWYMTHRQPVTNDSNGSTPPISIEPTTKEDVKTTPESDTPSDDIPVVTKLAVNITKLLQTDGVVTIAGTVSGEGAGAGTCVANFTTPEDHPIAKEVAAKVVDGKVTCGPVDIDEVEFSFLGDWQARLTFYTPGNKAQASSEPKNITIH